MSPLYRGPFTSFQYFLLSLYAFVILVGTVGNGMVIKTFYENRDQPGSRYVLVLAFVDFITSIWIPVMMIGLIVVQISDYIHLWPFGKVLCYLRPFGFSFFVVSSWLLVAICLERMR